MTPKNKRHNIAVARGYARLLGLPRDYLNAQLGAWRTGMRQAHAPDCMGQIAQRMSADDIQAVAHWLSSQAVAEGGKPAARLDKPLPIRCGGVQEGAR